MAEEKTNKEYDYYTLKIPNSLRRLFERYITKYRSLGFNKVAQYVSHILQEKALELLKDNPDLVENKKKD